MIERGADAVTRVVQARTKAHIVPHIVRFVKEGSRLHTDEASNFKLLKEKHGYDHGMVDHLAKEYVRGDVHANSIESFWSQVKRGINGTYVWVSQKHLQPYLREFEYRHKLRKQPALMFELLLQDFPKVRVG
jgi:transposase